MARKQAIHAAEWAVDEAVGRDVPYAWSHVIQAESKDASVEIEHAETALRAAHAAVEATGKSVDIDESIVRGSVDTVLVNESVGAEMVCVGSVGIGQIAQRLLGSTAVALAESAQCPVAIIRTTDAPRSESDCIAALLDDSPDNESVLQAAMEEARLRNAPIAVLGMWPFTRIRHSRSPGPAPCRVAGPLPGCARRHRCTAQERARVSR